MKFSWTKKSRAEIIVRLKSRNRADPWYATFTRVSARTKTRTKTTSRTNVCPIWLLIVSVRHDLYDTRGFSGGDFTRIKAIR